MDSASREDIELRRGHYAETPVTDGGPSKENCFRPFARQRTKHLMMAL